MKLSVFLNDPPHPASDTSLHLPTPPTSPLYLTSLPLLCRAELGAPSTQTKAWREHEPKKPPCHSHSRDDRLSSHGDQHCHPQHGSAQTHMYTSAHEYTQRARRRAYAHTRPGPTPVKLLSSLTNTDNQVLSVTSVIFTPQPDNTSRIPLAMGTT